MVCGILTLCVPPVLFLFFSLGLQYLVFEVSAIVLVLIAGAAQLIIGRGIYKGRRWGWVITLIGSLVSLAINVEVLAVFAFVQVAQGTIATAEAALSLMSLLLDVILLCLIFAKNSRVYCRMVDVHI